MKMTPALRRFVLFLWACLLPATLLQGCSGLAAMGGAVLIEEATSRDVEVSRLEIIRVVNKPPQPGIEGEELGVAKAGDDVRACDETFVEERGADAVDLVDRHGHEQNADGRGSHGRHATAGTARAHAVQWKGARRTNRRAPDRLAGDV